MRAIHVVRQFSPSVGGLEEAVLKLCGALQKRGVETSVVTLNRIANGQADPLPSVTTVDGVDVRRIPFRGSWRYPLAPGVLAHLGSADVVHVHAIDFFFDFLAATKLIHGKPLIASTHGGFFHTSFAQHLKRLYFQTITRASAQAYHAVCASSESDFELFRPVAGRRLVLAPNGVDVEKWHGLASPHPVRTLLYIGRFSSNKNIAALFPLLQRLRVLHPAWTLTIAGRPWDVSTTGLLAAAAQRGVSDAVTILESPNDQAIAAAIGGASYIVSASRHEGFGISIVEGLSAGLVPVLSRIPPFEKLVADARVGLLTDFDDAPASAAMLESLHQSAFADPSRARSSAIASASRHSWDVAADTIQRCYAEAVDRGVTDLSHSPVRTLP